MSESGRLYKCYKQKETSAFNLLFGHSEWRAWSFRKLVKLAKLKLSSIGPRRDRFASLLKNATVCREKLSASFLHAPDTQKVQHKYVVVCYRKLLAKVSNMSAYTQKDPEHVLHHSNPSNLLQEVLASPSPVCAEYESLEESCEHLQDYLFLDIIERCIDTIVHLWRLAREDALSISTATTGRLPDLSRSLSLIRPQFRTASTRTCAAFYTQRISCQRLKI
jgi:hypothetical protein